MRTEADFLLAILAEPSADDTWLVLADWLEEQGQVERAELVRLQVLLRREERIRSRTRPEKRVQALLASGVAPCVPKLVVTGGIELALIPPGIFWMGSTRQLPSADSDEHPRHKVEITRPFFLGIHPVTQWQYEQVKQLNPSYFRPGEAGAHVVKSLDSHRLPVENVSHIDAVDFCTVLSTREAEAKLGRKYRLPTEAEWEYACRGGISHSAYNIGSRLTRKDARFEKMGGAHPVHVGSFRPNLFGLYDMHGNVWEWCADWYDPEYYRTSPPRDPRGPITGHRRVLRGGGWSTSSDYCRSALRGSNKIDARHNYNGFRLALSIPMS